MAAVNSSVLACKYVASDASFKPAVAGPAIVSYPKLPVIRAQLAGEGRSMEMKEGRRAAVVGLAALVLSTAAVSSAKAGVIDEYLERSKANKELNDKKRLATINANFARAYTVQFGTCKFPENFTGCQDLAKKKVDYISS